MSEPIVQNHRSRSRAQSLFECRPRTGTDLTIALLEKLIWSQSSSNQSTETTTSTDENKTNDVSNIRRLIFFFVQPICAGLVIFPILILYWQSGWNFMDEWLNSPIAESWFIPTLLYFLAQVILLCLYMNQEYLYDYLHKQSRCCVVKIILQCHILLTTSTYILQWVTMWKILDRYTSQDWLLMLMISITALLGIAALLGHPCDLVCAPFILSYDSVEYNIRIGSPFVTEKINIYLAHFVNYFFYEYLISFLSILAWRGFYSLVDVIVFPKSPSISAASSLGIGYPVYFLLMYTQSHSYQNSTSSCFTLNCPLFIQNLRHLLAFFTCVLLWRGYWLLFDTHIGTMTLAIESPYVFYPLCNLFSFLVLSILKTASSINGPMSHMPDPYDLFPDYPNSYLIFFYQSWKKSGEVSSNASQNPSLEQYTVAFLE